MCKHPVFVFVIVFVGYQHTVDVCYITFRAEENVINRKVSECLRREDKTRDGWFNVKFLKFLVGRDKRLRVPSKKMQILAK